MLVLLSEKRVVMPNLAAPHRGQELCLGVRMERRQGRTLPSFCPRRICYPPVGGFQQLKRKVAGEKRSKQPRGAATCPGCRSLGARSPQPVLPGGGGGGCPAPGGGREGGGERGIVESAELGEESGAGQRVKRDGSGWGLGRGAGRGKKGKRRVQTLGSLQARSFPKEKAKSTGVRATGETGRNWEGSGGETYLPPSPAVPLLQAAASSPRWPVPRIRNYPATVIPAEPEIKPEPSPPPARRLPISAPPGQRQGQRRGGTGRGG